MQEKYQSMRSLFNKDKFIGRPSREEEFNTVISASKDLKYLLANPSLSPFVRNTLTPVRQTGNPNPIRGNLASNTSMIDEVNVMLEQLKSGSRVKRSLNYEEEAYNDTDKCEENVKAEFSRHKWECVTTIDAHSSPILSLAVYENFLISAATRNIRVWDLETNKIQSDITGPSLNSFVKATVVHREKHLMATACDKNVTLWDLRTLNTEGVLKGHRDDIKCMHIVGDLLFSAGKGISNCGSLLVWDLRYFNVNCPM